MRRDEESMDLRERDEPPRLRDAAGLPGLRSALEAARAERPSEQRLAGIAGALPLGMGAGAGAGAPGLSLKAKVLIGVSAIAVGGGAGWVAQRTGQDRGAGRPSPSLIEPAAPQVGPAHPAILPMRSPGPQIAREAPEAPRPAREQRRPRPPAARGTVEAEPKAAPKPAPAPKSEPAARPEAAPSVVDVAAETRLLEAAKASLASRPAETRRLVDEHALRFAAGLLVQEREVIAIEALFKLRATGEAEARARAFATRFPRSAHLRRVQALLEAGSAARP
jgi:hypothetical protein